MFESIKALFSGKKVVVNVPLAFDGDTYDKTLDEERLGSQLDRVISFMADGNWHDLDEVVAESGGTHASISARLRDLRKPKFGGYTVLSRRVGSAKFGYWQYLVIF
jgi:hypothetical protein